MGTIGHRGISVSGKSQEQTWRESQDTLPGDGDAETGVSVLQASWRFFPLSSLPSKFHYSEFGE